MHPKTLSVNTRHLVLMASVKDAPFKCSSCKKIFITENHLRRHENRRHNLKTPLLSSEQVKERTNETSNDSTINAVLNATERIEDLLVKLSIKENENSHNVPAPCSSPRSILGDSLVTSSSVITEKNEQGTENSKCISDDITSNKKTKKLAELKYYKKSNFEDSLAAFNTFAAGNSEQNIGDFMHVSINSIEITKPKEVDKFDHNKRNSLEDSLVVANSFTAEKSELNIDNTEHSSINSIKIIKPREVVKSEYNKKSNFEDSLATSYSFTAEKSKQNTNNFAGILIESSQVMKTNERGMTDYNKKRDFEDFPGTSNAFTDEKSKQYTGNPDHIWYDSASVTELKNIDDLEHINKSNFEDSPATFEISEQNSEHISTDSILVKKPKTITKMTFSDFLSEEENKAIWRITSSVIKSKNEILDPIYSENEYESEKNDLITPFEDSYLARRPVLKCRPSLKTDILNKLDRKLESFGIDCSKNTLSYKDMKRVGHLLKEERDRIAEGIPDYHKLRQLIEDNAQRRIKENLRSHRTYVS